MSTLSRVWSWLTEPMEQRSDILDPSISYPDIDEQLYARQRAQAGLVPTITIREALGIPSIFRAVNLLSSLTATLDLKEYVNQREVPAASVVLRPCKQWTPGSFKRDTVMYMATRGEAIWLVMERDFQDKASSLLPVAPETIKSDWNGLTHNWYSDASGKRVDYKPEDVVHIPMMRDPHTGRGVGPMQLCGLALNIAREADVWASRFFVGSIPSLYLDSAQPIDAEDADVIKQRWLKDPPNVPKVGYGLTPTPLNIDMESAQSVDSRKLTRGEAALMMGIPGKLLEYAESGSSLVYQNVGDLTTELVRLTLAPNYLEPIEQALSDLRPRGTEVRFDVSGLERADAKTRYDVHEKAIALGVYDADYAREVEGIAGNSPDVVPVPLRIAG